MENNALLVDITTVSDSVCLLGLSCYDSDFNFSVVLEAPHVRKIAKLTRSEFIIKELETITQSYQKRVFHLSVLNPISWYDKDSMLVTGFQVPSKKTCYLGVNPDQIERILSGAEVGLEFITKNVETAAESTALFAMFKTWVTTFDLFDA